MVHFCFNPRQMKYRKAIAIGVVLVLPVMSYLIVERLSRGAVRMPRRYFPDSVGMVTVDGKTRPDTQWHRIRPFTLTNQFGRDVSLDEWKGRIIIADFIFTSCPTVCPTLTRNMKRLQDAFRKTDSLVRFVSFTVDPARDSAARLKAYGDRFRIDHDTWWMLTGPKSEIYDIALNEFKANIAQAEGVDTGFIHTDKFFLLDRDRVVRGWYSGLDSVRLDEVIRDVVLLNMERDKKKKRNLFRK
jgi:protein SCO1/2